MTYLAFWLKRIFAGFGRVVSTDTLGVGSHAYYPLLSAEGAAQDANLGIARGEGKRQFQNFGEPWCQSHRNLATARERRIFRWSSW